MKKILILLSLLSFTTLFNCSTEDPTVIAEEEFSSENILLSFSFEAANNTNLSQNVTGVISEADNTVNVTIPPTVLQGDVTQLVATFRLSDGASIFVGSVEQESANTANDFSQVVEYRVVAENDDEARYNVVVNNLLSSENSILSFGFRSVSNVDLDLDVMGTIDSDNSINVEFPIGSYAGDLTDLVATFEISDRATIFVGDNAQVSEQNINDFSQVVEYRVVAEDGSESIYNITVTELLNFQNSLLSFDISTDQNSRLARSLATKMLVGENKIRFHNPHFDINSLVPTFELPFGAVLSLNGRRLESGSSTIDFSNSVQLEVTAENGDIALWDIEMTREIVDLEDFLSVCPLEDPNISIILSDFEFRLNGDVIDQFPCEEPFYLMDRPSDLGLATEHFTETTYLQALRFLYYLDYDNPHIVPWSQERLYDWVVSKLDALDIVDGVAGGRFCGNVNGSNKATFGNNRNPANPNLINFSNCLAEGFRLINISLLLHEARHADGFPHTSGCCTLGRVCDDELDLENPSAYGIMVWWAIAHWEGTYNFNAECFLERSSNNSAGRDLMFIFNPNNWSDFFCSGDFIYEFPESSFSNCAFEE